MACGYVILRRGVLTPTDGELSTPGSGAQITLWSSAGNPNSSYGGARFKRLIVNLYVSHASGTNGLLFQESADGTNWRDLVSYTVAATTLTKTSVGVSAPYVRVLYTNSANVLSAFELTVMGDCCERGS